VAVAECRAAHPEGTPEELIAAIGRHFRPDWTPVLRALLFVNDRHRAREVAAVITGPARAGR